MDNYRICRKCRSYVKHDEFFGYCVKYACQARWNDNCSIIMEMLPDE